MLQNFQNMMTSHSPPQNMPYPNLPSSQDKRVQNSALQNFPVVIQNTSSVSSKQVMTPEERVYEYTASGSNLDIEKIQNVLLDNGITQIFTERTPNGSSIEIKVTNPTQQ